MNPQCGEPEEWLQHNFPNCIRLDHDWTMRRYDFPIEVQTYIMKNWIKDSNLNGGTYSKPDNQH
jgi:hypothetical protein